MSWAVQEILKLKSHFQPYKFESVYPTDYGIKPSIFCQSIEYVLRRVSLSHKNVNKEGKLAGTYKQQEKLNPR